MPPPRASATGASCIPSPLSGEGAPPLSSVTGAPRATARATTPGRKEGPVAGGAGYRSSRAPPPRRRRGGAVATPARAKTCPQKSRAAAKPGGPARRAGPRRPRAAPRRAGRCHADPFLRLAAEVGSNESSRLSTSAARPLHRARGRSGPSLVRGPPGDGPGRVAPADGGAVRLGEVPRDKECGMASASWFPAGGRGRRRGAHAGPDDT